MQTSFRRVAYYLFLIAGIFASVSLHMMALIGSYWLEGEGLDETFNVGLWQSCIGVIKCTNVLDNAHLLAGRFKATQAFMVLACLSTGLSLLVLILTAVRPKKFIFRILSTTIFISVQCNIIAMACFTDLQNDEMKLKLTPLHYGWSYYAGWAAMGVSLGTGLISLLHECLPPVNQNPTLLSGQPNKQVTYFAAASSVNVYQTPYTGESHTATPINYGYQTPHVVNGHLAEADVNASETRLFKNSNSANPVINASKMTGVENSDKANPGINETNIK